MSWFRTQEADILLLFEFDLLCLDFVITVFPFCNHFSVHVVTYTEHSYNATRLQNDVAFLPTTDIISVCHSFYSAKRPDYKNGSMEHHSAIHHCLKWAMNALDVRRAICRSQHHSLLILPSLSSLSSSYPHRMLILVTSRNNIHKVKSY